MTYVLAPSQLGAVSVECEDEVVMVPPKQKDPTESRASIIEKVKTPLGFFSLVVLVVEVIMGGGLLATAGTDRTLLIKGMIAILPLAFLVVAGIAAWRPESLYGVPHKGNRSISLFILAPEVPPDLRGLDISRIDWAQEHCHLVIGEERERIRLVPSRKGSCFDVEMPKGITERLENITYLELDLMDQKGNRWFVKPFPPFEQPLRLSTREPVEKVIADYTVKGA